METSELRVGDWVKVPLDGGVGQIVHIFTKQQTMSYPYVVLYMIDGIECEGHFSLGELRNEKITEKEAMLWKLSN